MHDFFGIEQLHFLSIALLSYCHFFTLEYRKAFTDEDQKKDINSC